MKTAVITGVTGMDGSHLSEFLLEKDYQVIGITRRSSVDNTERLTDALGHDNFTLVEGDVIDPTSVNAIVSKYRPDEFYNLAAQSHVGTSFEQPHYTFQVNAVGVLNVLEAIRNYSHETRFYQASTSEMFGNNYTEETIPNYTTKEGFTHTSHETFKFQDENTTFAPNSPYSVAKLAAHHMVSAYNEAYNLFGCCGILFNHEGPRRGESFVTRKITKWIGDVAKWSKEHPTIFENAQISAWENMDDNYLYQGLAGSPKFPKLRLGNLDAKRDWGYAPDFVEAMWLMLQQDKPDNYVVATGETHSIREFLDHAFAYIGIDKWDGYVVIDPKFYRPADVEYLCGLPSKAEQKLGWKRNVTFKELVQIMVDGDLKERVVCHCNIHS